MGDSPLLELADLLLTPSAAAAGQPWIFPSFARCRKYVCLRLITEMSLTILLPSQPRSCSRIRHPAHCERTLIRARVLTGEDWNDLDSCPALTTTLSSTELEASQSKASVVCSSRRFAETGTTQWDSQDRQAARSNFLLRWLISLQAFFEWLEELTEEGVLVEMD